jgi:transcriptional regulator with XRE-family HTH domain
MSAVAFTDTQLAASKAVARAIGDSIRTRRLARGETQEAVAHRLGTHPTTVSRIEAGADANPKLGSLMKILNEFDLTLCVVAVEISET